MKHCVCGIGRDKPKGHKSWCGAYKPAVAPTRVSVSFSEAELWELINNFDASYMGDEGNELARKVSAKLHKAHERFSA